MNIPVILIYGTFSLVVFGYSITMLNWEDAQAVFGLGYFFHLLSYLAFFLDKKEHRNKSFLIPIGLFAFLFIAMLFKNLNPLLLIAVLHVPMTIYLYWLFLKRDYLGSLGKRSKSVLRTLSWVLLGMFFGSLLLKILHIQGSDMLLLFSSVSFAVLSFIYAGFKAVN